MIKRLLVLGLVAGCGAAPLTFGLHRHAWGSALIKTGVPVREQVFTTTPGREARKLVLPSRPHCEVTAPSGATVGCSFSDWTQPSLDEDNGVAVLSYVVSEPGWHDVKVWVDEGDELAWRAFAVERRGELVTELAQPCGWVEPVGTSGWMCDERFLRAGEPAQWLSAELTSAAGDVVWTFNTGEVRRFRDPGVGPLVPEPRFDTGVFAATRLFATQTDAVVQHAGGWALLEVAASGAVEKTASLERAFAEGAVVRRLGAILLVGEPVGEETEVCVFSIAPASFTTGACRRYPGTLVGEGDGGGLALISGPVFRVVNASLDEGVAVELPEMLVSAPPTAARRGFAILPGSIIPRVSEGALRLESYAGGSLVASEAYVWARTQGTTVMSR